jgi:hypothetical protein
VADQKASRENDFLISLTPTIKINPVWLLAIPVLDQRLPDGDEIA